MSGTTEGSHDPIINSLEDLCRTVTWGNPGTDWEDRVDRISKILFKSTYCGIIFFPKACSVIVAGYVEGGDFGCPEHELEYPFKASEFWEAVTEADREGCTAWDEMQDGYNEEFC